MLRLNLQSSISRRLSWLFGEALDNRDSENESVTSPGVDKSVETLENYALCFSN